VTGIKEPYKALIGDTVTHAQNPTLPLAGYNDPQPVVWTSVYPESQDDFEALRNALSRLKLSDASLSFDEEVSPALGRGFRCGFLGMLHLEIVLERLRREYELVLVVTSPTIVYEVEYADRKRESIYSPAHFPEHGAFRRAYEPWVNARIIVPRTYMGEVMQTLYSHEAEVAESSSLGKERLLLHAHMPLRELMRGFFDEIKSASSGYASFSYELESIREADIVRLDILIADEVVPAFSSIVPRERVYREAKRTVERLHGILPRQLFPTKIQGKALGRIFSSKTLPALKKDVTGHLYGGDVTRKRKLWEKQKKGKKKLKAHGRIHIPHEIFIKMIKRDS